MFWALGYLGGRIRSLSKLKNTPKALISGQKSTLIIINDIFSLITHVMVTVGSQIP